MYWLGLVNALLAAAGGEAKKWLILEIRLTEALVS